MSDAKLLPCPHCNGPAHLVIGDEFCRIRCHQCGATGGPADAIRESDAINAWNRRPTDTPASGEREGEESELSEKDLAMIDWAWETHKAAAPAPSPPSQASEIERLTREKDLAWKSQADMAERYIEAARKEMAQRLRADEAETRVSTLLAKVGEQGTRIMELEATIVLSERAMTAQTVRLSETNARVKELEAALEPFAKSLHASGYDVEPVPMNAYRNARAVLQGKGRE